MFVHVHEITDAEARVLSICCLLASKRSEKVWPSVRCIKALLKLGPYIIMFLTVYYYHGCPEEMQDYAAQS
jgi:hypothetical protein